MAKCIRNISEKKNNSIKTDSTENLNLINLVFAIRPMKKKIQPEFLIVVSISSRLAGTVKN